MFLNVRNQLQALTCAVASTVVFYALPAQAADTRPVVSAASAVKASAAASAVAGGASGAVKKNTGVATGTATIGARGGENAYPTGGILIPPKPKKEGLEAAGAVKAKAAQP